MATLTRTEIAALGSAALVALVMPLWLLQPDPVSAPAAAVTQRPLGIVPPPPLSAAYTRSLFGEGGQTAEEAALPSDAPQLVGVVGRIGSDAVALVRTDGGRTRTLAIGAAIDGWTLESLAIDAAFFTRGTQRLRVPLPSD